MANEQVHTATLIWKGRKNLDVYQGVGTTKKAACQALTDRYNMGRQPGSEDDGYMKSFDHLIATYEPEDDDFYGKYDGWFIVYDILDVVEDPTTSCDQGD